MGLLNTISDTFSRIRNSFIKQDHSKSVGKYDISQKEHLKKMQDNVAFCGHPIKPLPGTKKIFLSEQSPISLDNFADDRRSSEPFVTFEECGHVSFKDEAVKYLESSRSKCHFCRGSVDKIFQFENFKAFSEYMSRCNEDDCYNSHKNNKCRVKFKEVVVKSDDSDTSEDDNIPSIMLPNDVYT